MDGRSRCLRAPALLIGSLLWAFSALPVQGQAMGHASIDDEPAMTAPARAAAEADLKQSQSLTVLTSAPSPAPASAGSPATPSSLTFTPMSSRNAASATTAASSAPATGDLALLTSPPPLVAPTRLETPPAAAAPLPDPAPQGAAALPAAPSAPSISPAPLTLLPTPVSSLEQKTIRKPSTSQPAAEGANGAIAAVPKIPSGIASAAQVFAALTVVIGLIFVGKALAKRYVPGAQGSGKKGVIEILARHPLSKNQSIVLVRIGSQIVALNQGKDQSQSVLVISDQSEVAKLMGQIDGQGPKSIQAGFNRLLANAAIDLEDPSNDPDRDIPGVDPHSLDDQLEEMAAARRQLMDLRSQVRTVRDKMPRA